MIQRLVRKVPGGVARLYWVRQQAVNLQPPPHKQCCSGSFLAPHKHSQAHQQKCSVPLPSSPAGTAAAPGLQGSAPAWQR